jgi:acyl transferase domain-containing protein
MSTTAAGGLAFIYGSREMIWGGIYPYIAEAGGVMRDALRECAGGIRTLLGWSLEDALGALDSHAPQAMVTPSLAAVQIALTEGWRSRGIRPGAILGRSAGEFAAEYARGVLSLDAAMEASCRWARLQQERGGNGTLLRVAAALQQVPDLLKRAPVPLYVVGDSTEQETVLACASADVSRVHAFLVASRIGHAATGFTFAPHSPLIDDWRQPLLTPPIATRPAPADIAYYSTGSQAPDAGSSYDDRLWQALRRPALMGRTLRRVIEDGYTAFVEIGGQLTLEGRIRARAERAGVSAAVLPSMRKGEPAAAVMEQTHARLRELQLSR